MRDQSLNQRISKSKIVLLISIFAMFFVNDIAIAEGLESKSTKTVPDFIRSNTDVVVSNYPLFLLSEAVTDGAPSAKLLLGAGDIGHHSSLSPNDMKVVRDSRYVVWFGDKLETNLAKPFASSHNTIALFDLDAFDRRPLRDVKGQPIKDTLDPHIWLDPNNAKAIVRALGAIHSRANPKYKAIYDKNVRLFERRMNVEVAKVSGAKVTKATTSLRPYWAYHDAFSYLEPSLALDMAGALTVDHHLPAKASQIMWLNKNRPKKSMCIVLQTDSNKNVLNKLKPVQSTVQAEDMSTAEDFITGWSTIANNINDCIAATGN